jgi:hypothetical protein
LAPVIGEQTDRNNVSIKHFFHSYRRPNKGFSHIQLCTHFCGAHCQYVYTKLLWCSLWKCCFPLYETFVVLLVKMLFPFARNCIGVPCQNVVFLCTKLLWCSLSKFCFPLYETSVVLFVKMLFSFTRNFCGALFQYVVSLLYETALVFLVKMLFSFVQNFCGALCQNVVYLCTKLLWCSLSKCCFPLHDTSVVLFVKMLFFFARNFCCTFCQNVVILCTKLLWCFLSKCCFPLHVTSVVLFVKMLFSFARNVCGALCQYVVSHCTKLVLFLVKVLFPKSINSFFGLFYTPFYNRNSDSLRTGRSGNRISVKKRFSVPVQTDPKPTQPPRQWMPGIPRE